MADSPPGRDLTARFRLLPGLVGITAEARDCLTNAVLPIGPFTENPPSSGRYIATIAAAAVPTPTRVRVTLLSPPGVASATQHYDVGAIGARQTRRPAIRRRILGRLYDEEALPGFTCVMTEADINGAVADPIVIGGVNEFRGHFVWFQDGRNMLAERLVTSYSFPDRRIGWAPPLPLAPIPGEHFELGPLRGSTLNDAIDDALEELRDQWLRPAADVTLTTDGVASEFILPDDFRLVGRVAYVDAASGALIQWLSPALWTLGPRRTLRFTSGAGSMEPDPMGWSMSRGAAPPQAGLRLRVEGHVALPQIVDDEQFVDAPIEALVDHAALALAQGMERHRAVLPFMAQRANRSRALAVTRVGTIAREVSA